MKYALLLSLTLFSFSAFSKMDKDHKTMEQKMNKMSFEDAKDMNIKMVEKKSEMLEDNRKCINEAKDKKELSKCMQKSMEDEREMKNTWKQEMKADYKEVKEDVKKKME